MVASKSHSSNSSDVSSDHVTNDIQGAVSFDSAAAQNIAVDGSTLTATNTSSIDLSGTAEQNATAINLVNAAGSMVANGVNTIAKGSNMGVLIITHYQRILHLVQPERVSIMFNGRIIKEGGPELVTQLEAEGYANIKEEAGVSA